jgi:small subunit ribosomal protein S7
MSRRRRAEKRETRPDPKYNSLLLSKFVSKIMERGKRTVAEQIVYDCFAVIEKKTGQPGFEVFQKAMSNVKPTLEVRPRRVGGATYQIPMEVRPERKNALAFRWILDYSRERKGMPMAEKLAEELIAASKNEGASIKKREDTHKMAEANRAFAHFRW